MIKNKSGVWGELYAARYLRDNKYRIITSNYVCRFGELDLVALRKGQLCIVEVKTRDEDASVRPMEAVDESKQEKLTMATNSFLKYSKLDYPTRFDVCEVYLDSEYNLVRLNYIENAF